MAYGSIAQVRGGPWGPCATAVWRTSVCYKGARVANTFHNVNVLLRTVVLLAIVLLGGWWTMLLRGKLLERERELETRTVELAQAHEGLEERDQRIGELGKMLEQRAAEVHVLEATVAEKERAIQALEVAKRLLRVDHRVARLEVLAQGSTADAPDRVRT